MSNAAENIDDDVKLHDDEVVDVKVNDEAKHSASPKHISRDDWIASGKDPDEWRSPREFRERGELIEQKKALEKELERKFDNQIKNLNTLHEIRLQNEREELLKRRDDAIDIADKAEVKRLDKQIADNTTQAELVQPVQVQPQVDPAIVEYMEENPWAKNALDPRTIYAQSIINEKIGEGKTLAFALRAADKGVAEKFSDPQKRSGPMVEASRTAGGTKQSTGTLAWSQLTPTEEKCYIPSMWKNEAEFLKAVANDRKGSK